jgi:hypothetical protein
MSSCACDILKGSVAVGGWLVLLGYLDMAMKPIQEAKGKAGVGTTGKDVGLDVLFLVVVGLEIKRCKWKLKFSD